MRARWAKTASVQVVPQSRQGSLFPAPHAIDKPQRDRDLALTRYKCPCGFQTAWYRDEGAALGFIEQHVRQHLGGGQ